MKRERKCFSGELEYPSFLFLNRPEQRMGMARVLSSYDLVLLQEIPCGEKARESLEYFCSVMNPGGDNPFDFL